MAKRLAEEVRGAKGKERERETSPPYFPPLRKDSADLDRVNPLLPIMRWSQRYRDE